MTQPATPEIRAQKVTIDILNREFAVACSPAEKPALLKAAKLLDERTRKLRSQGVSTSQFDQLLVVVALNLCNELNGSGASQTENKAPQGHHKIQHLIEKIDNVMSE